MRRRRAAHREDVAGISAPFTYRRSIRANLQLGVKKMLRSSRRVCYVPCCGLCRLTFPSPSVWAVRFPAITTGRGSVILRPTRTITCNKNVGFHIIWEEWEELSGLDSATLLCQRPEKQRQEHQTCEQRDPTCTTHLGSDGLSFFCHSRSDLEKVGRHHHHAHTPHLALPLVSLPLFFSDSMSPLLYRLRMNANSTIICPCVLGRKPR